MIRAVVALLLLAGAAPGITVEQIVAGNRRVLDGINDFVCVMTFNISSTSVRVPDTRVRIYFKKPDRMKPEPIDGDFTVLPKTYRMAIGNVLERMVEEHTAKLLGEETVDGRRCYRLKLTPKEEGTGILYHLVDVDREQFTVIRVRTYPEGQQPATVSLRHERHGRGYLPSQAVLEASHRPREGEALEQVRATIRFTGYRINTGLSDAIFAEPPESAR